MNADFLDEHFRPWDDAELLKSKGRLANADQLYGVAAEFGLKRQTARILTVTPLFQSHASDYAALIRPTRA